MVDCYENINNKYMRSIDRRVFKWKKMTRELLVSANLPFVTYRLYIMRVVWTVKQTKRRHLSWKVVVFFFFVWESKWTCIGTCAVKWIFKHLRNISWNVVDSIQKTTNRFSMNDKFFIHMRDLDFFLSLWFFLNSCSLF